MSTPTKTRPPVSERAERVRSALVLGGLLALSAAVFTISSLVSRAGALLWYGEAVTAPWTAPNWVFGSVWSLMHIVTSVAAWLVWRERKRRVVTGALTLYGTQLMLNALWQPVLLGLYPVIGRSAIWLAAAIIVLLAATIVAFVREIWNVNRAAALSLLPYLAWILYSASLNIALGVLN